jgi:hypothetical protein
MADHQPDEDTSREESSRPAAGRPYLRFALMIAASAVVMYGVMYLNTYAIDHVYLSWTRVFMTMMSAATMAVIMLWFMRHMYRNARLNALVVGIAVVLFGTGLWLVRSQATIGDAAWMEGMIPHHSIAILTSENAQLTDPRVRQLADSIIEAQRAEIEEMKDLLEHPNG